MTDDERLNAILTKVNEIWQGLYGIPDTGDKGLCGRFDELAESHSKLNGNFKLLVGILGGSGVLGGTIIGLLKLLG